MVLMIDSICAILISLLIINTVALPVNLTADDGLNSTNATTKTCIGVVTACVVLNVNLPKKCFSADSWIYLTDGQKKNIGHLRRGDILLASDGLTPIASEMVLMLDSDPYSEAIFYTLQTESNHTISLTGQHLIPIVSNKQIPQYVPAEHVKVGDLLYVLSENGFLIQSPVLQVRIEIKLGYFAPMTMSGTLLVNNVLASCFSEVYSHEIAQVSMGPLRWYHKIANIFSIIEPFGAQKPQGIHWVPQIMLNFAQKVFPSALQLPSKHEYDICHTVSPAGT